MIKREEIVKGIYSMSTPNEDICLLSSKATFKFRKMEYKGYSAAYIKFIPSPHIIFEAQINCSDAILLDMVFSNEKIELYIPSKKLSADTIAIGTSDKDDFQLILLAANPKLSFGTVKSVQKIVMHILNLPKLYGNQDTSIDINGNNIRIGIISLQVDNWEIRINQNTKVANHEELLKKYGGYLITHVGSIGRKDGKNISIDDVEYLQELLKYFLSFARGLFTAPFLLVGYNKKGNRVWEYWNTHLLEDWKIVSSWFDHYNTQILSDVFPNFYNLWRSNWHDDLKRAIYWYLRSNSLGGGLEGSIILAQAALELISWSLLVKERKCISSDGYKKLSASDKISLLLSTLNIPIEVPSNMKKLKKIEKSDNLNGPAIVTEARKCGT